MPPKTVYGTVTVPAEPPVRSTTITAASSDSEATKDGLSNRRTPGPLVDSSSAWIVSTSVAYPPRIAPPVGLLSLKMRVVSPSFRWLSWIGTVTDWQHWPSRKVKVPEVAVYSSPAVAVPSEVW